MLDWLKRRRRKGEPAHPLQSDPGLKEVLAGIPMQSPAIALPELANWLRSVDELKSGPARALTRAVRKLDEAAQPVLQVRWRELAGKPGQDLPDEPRQALLAYYEAQIQAYLLALEVGLGDDQISQEKNYLALLGVRAMRAMMHTKLLARLRYRYPESSFWRATHDLLALARSNAFSHLKVIPYSGSDAASIQAEYLAGLLLEVAPIENLLPAQLLCADALIAQQCHGILFRDSAGATVPYYVDVAADQGPSRTPPADPHPETARFFGVGKLGPHLFGLLKQVGACDEPPQVALDSGCDLDEYRRLLKILCDHWLGNPPQRRHPRRKAEAELLAVHGFSLVRRMVAASCFARSGRPLGYRTDAGAAAHHAARHGHADEASIGSPEADEPLDKMSVLLRLETAGDRDLMEQWTLVDISERGLGAVMSHHRRWLQVGSLIAFRLKDSIDWRAGIVRRIGRGGHGRRMIGVEVLRGMPAPVQCSAGGSVDQTPWGAIPEFMSAPWFDGILISAVSGQLVVERGRFNAGLEIDLILEGNVRRVRMLELVEQSKDFELLTYEEIDTPTPA